MTTSINKSRLMKRAWYLVKERSYTISYAMKTVWTEMKEAIKERIAKLVIDKTVQYVGSTWISSPETMYNYYNTSTYKGD